MFDQFSGKKLCVVSQEELCKVWIPLSVPFPAHIHTLVQYFTGCLSATLIAAMMVNFGWLTMKPDGGDSHCRNEFFFRHKSEGEIPYNDMLS